MSKLPVIAFVGLTAFVSGAAAQTGDMSCADYLKVEAQAQASLSAQDKAMLQADPQAAAIDAKVKAYCRANPKVLSSEAVMKAMQ
ncbi:hypothetical protein [Methylobacterium gnaphalii]|uniref:Acid stress chaperone HdeA n=1 Tax=Methylobacterium gnaphalii TaxID=1010610 RepID=A0A512JMK1_9HYPH|nr:hypothetical protein [Methylobacterium gnaphalii]GEP11197.1 hypothetical protein MGN01_30420 [Methylobacterium gnaphalii]GJD70066.1 hypothetical protein MMMDOFMJ_3006 [Methylobacterium gnaphalii]GLS49702.1 hypothetical protein GCM10007885_25520 [Methylobacterium gnaphalii]